MARKTHRPDDILWTVTTADIDAARSEKQDVTLGEVLDTKYPRKSLVKLFEEKLIHINGHKATPRMLSPKVTRFGLPWRRKK